MKLNYLALAVPFFLFFIALEYYWSKRKGRQLFQYAETVANLNVGIAERLIDVFTTGLFFYFFDWIHSNYAIFSIKAGPLTWIALFLLTDLVWYWYHRLAHEVNLFWSAHVVHHQSEDFNYTVSARITVFQAVVRSLFWAVLPLVGFPAEMISVFLLVHGLYPFFIHTQTIGKLGWLEYVLVTPSHHRVHHASNPAYLDRNYGDVLIIWDRIFGTFVEEEEEPVYGLTKPLGSHSFLWQHFHFGLELVLALRQTPGLRAKIKLLFGPPDAVDPRFRRVLERRLSNVRRGPAPTAALRQYITAQTAFSLVLLFCTLLFVHYFSAVELFLLSFFILLSLVNSGAMLDQRRWVFYLEFARLMTVLVAVGVFYRNNWLISVLALAAGLLAYYFQPMERAYLDFLYAGKRRNR